MSAASSHYEAYQARRELLASLIERASPGFAGLGMGAWVETLEKLLARVQSDRFRVMILGEFKRGKSTFINALLKAEVLPADIAPCTAVINEVKWGETPKAMLHFRQPPPEKLGTLPSDARRHLDRHRGGVIPPMEIPVADLQEFVAIPDPTADQAASIAESPFDRVELFWPLDLCRSGVEIIDSPGLNEHHTRTRTTRDYLAHIDAVVFVMSVHALASESELAVIDNDLRPTGHEYLFFVCNRFDELRKREDRDKITSYAYAKLADRTRFGREGIFFLSAFDALEGRLVGDPALIGRSGIVPLEKSLERFLVEDRGRVKLLQPGGLLVRGLRAAMTEVIPGRRKLMEEDGATLRRRLDEARPQLDQAGRRRDNVLKQVEAARMRVRDAVRREAERFFSDLSRDVPLWSRRMETVRINPAIVWNQRGQAEQVAEQLIGQLVPAIEASLETWQRTTLRPLIDQQLKELAESLNTSVEPFLEYLDGLKAKLAGRTADMTDLSTAGTFSLDRLLTGGGGLIVGAGLILASTTNIGLVVASAGLTGAATAVAAKVGALLMSMANPITLGALVVGFLALNHHRGAALTERVKLEVAERVATQLRQEARERSDSIGTEVYDQTAPLAEAISSGIEFELRQVREQVEAILSSKEKGEAEIDRQRAEVAQLESTLRAVADEMNELIFLLGHRG